MSRSNGRQLDKALSAQAWLCHWCGIPIENREDATREHLVPRNRGGGSTQTNIVAVHLNCNMARGDKNTPLSPRYIHHQQIRYFKAVGLHAKYPWHNTAGDNRRREIPNFGYDHDGATRLWAPQYGLVWGPCGDRRVDHTDMIERRRMTTQKHVISG